MAMDELKTKIKNANLNNLKDLLSAKMSEFELTMSIMIGIGVAIITFIIVMFFGVWKLRSKVLPSQTGGPRKPRFRKRDKVMFYGRKMLRKVQSFTRKLGPPNRGKLKKRQIVMKLAKNSFNLHKWLLQLRRESSQPLLRVKEPPQSFLELDTCDIDDSEQRLPSEVLYMLRSTRIFGHFEKPLFLSLVKHMESKILKCGEYLFRIGDLDDSIYVVQEGHINVKICESDGTNYLVKEVCPGDSIHSLLSVLDVLTGHAAPYKTVSAQAAEDSTVLKLPAIAFQSMFDRFPESLVRIVQIIMIRLQRVTFTALHNYLGLSSELISSQLIEELHAMRMIGQASAKRHSICVVTQKEMRTLSGRFQSSPHKQRSSVRDSSWHRDISVDREEPGQRGAQLGSEGKDKLDGETHDDTDGALTDFAAAAQRARINSLDLETSKASDDPVKVIGHVPRSRMKKMSDTGMYVSQTSVDTSEEEALECARKDLIKLLNLQDESLLDGRLSLRKYKAGTTILNQGDQDASLLFVVAGTLKLLQQVVGKEQKEALLFNAYPGELVGALAVLTGEPSFFTIRCKYECRLVLISKEDFYSIMQAQPSVVLSCAHTSVVRMTPFVRQIDFALDWILTEAGKALFRQGDQSDHIYIVLTGRLRSVITKENGKKELVGEYGRGELVGIVEVLTEAKRTTTVMAVRDTECAKLPAELLNLIKRKYPQIVTRLIHLLGERLLGQLQTKSTTSFPIADPVVKDQTSVGNLATVAVLPISRDVQITSFTLELQHALQVIGSTMRLTSDIVKENLGSAALDSVNEFRLLNWLGQQEDANRMTLYQCDYTLTKWTKNCIRQADCILVVGLFEGDPAVSEIEKQMETMSVRAQKELILLHREDADTPKGTVEWLNARGWLSSHHHIKCPKRVLTKRTEAKIIELYKKHMETKADRMSDFSRLARFLTGTSIGVVLGGGGARGLSHVGMLKALVEAEIPVDMVGGTSIGAFIGALYADSVNMSTFGQRAREWSIGMTSLWKKILDITYPVTSMFTGKAFNDGIEFVFEHRQIEDLWIPYFCITTDISDSSMKAHTHGSLWRYVRASMSLSGYLPPMCDPVNGHLLLDGGYINNLPADVMKAKGARNIFAMDVGSIDETDLTNYGDHLSGWWLLWKRWNPWAAQVKVPDMAEIQTRLAYVSGVRQLEMVKNSDFCEYIRPPIDKYGTLQFGSYDEISEVGYNHGKTLLNGWIKGGLIDELFKDKHSDHFSKCNIHKVQTHMPAMAKFTDLAELVSQIEKPKHGKKPTFYSENDDIFEEDSDDSFSDEVLLEEDEEEEEVDENMEDYKPIEPPPQLISSMRKRSSGGKSVTYRLDK
ncbi:patatin-like phospholipase domain-containing protein 7 isoform X2 [Crassostrea angulata]|uniref:patatin-like phospholipase domain-containing protein 7 isoform X2 n=1 Tax=Magallana angulata TaxID=2784310 RepID=UPI0022B1C931|nr:patatin-like phospholipase domain-containing protein 7 isoform X2 [Crassostrea angulata]